MISASSASASSAEPLTPPTVLSAYDHQYMGNHQQEPGMPCKWKECDYTAPSPDDLYDHLCNTHIGRKSTGNLCLTCAWEGCGVKCVKRDHITSHLRVHTPLKPHTCAVCPKTFKRPQDLKKHERIHTQEHHQLHKHSKAATSDDPNFNRRVAPAPGVSHRGLADSYGMPSQAAMNSLSPASLSSQSVSPSSSHSQIVSSFPANSGSPYEHLLPGGSHSPIPPPALAALHRKQHEELAAYQARELLVLQQLASQQQQQAATATGAKRGWSDDSATNQFDGFYADMKKRRMEPVYDASMIDRLNSLVPPSMTNSYPGMPAVPSYFTPHFQQQSYPPPPPAPQQSSYPPFGPDIRSESDLAMFNQFMVTLGRDAAYGPQMEHTASTSGSSTSGDDLFDNDALASLGLAGMPGIPEQNTPPSTVNFGSLYPSLDMNGLNMRRNTSPGPGGREDVSKRTIAGLPRPPVASFGNRSASLSAATPAAHSHSFYETLAQGGGLDDSSLGYDDRFGFDSLARSRGAALPSAHIAPKDYYKKAFRAVEPLGAAKPRESAERSGIPEEDEDEEEDEAAVSPPLPLASLLHDDEANPEYKLPAIAPQSTSAQHLPSLLRSRTSTASPSSSRSGSPASVPRLPSIDAALTGTLKRPTTADGLARQVKRLELDADVAYDDDDDEEEDIETPVQARALSEREKRRLHALWIRQVIVSVNTAFKQQQQQRAESQPREEFDRERTPGVTVA